MSKTAPVLLFCIGALAMGRGGQSAARQRPTFRAATDVVLIDAQVVARDGTPIDGLKPEQFDVFIDGRRRPLLSAEFVRVAAMPPARGARPAPALPESVPAVPGGRIVLLGIDQMSFPASAQWSAREAARRVVDSLAPEDSLGLVAFPGRVAIAPTRDRAPIRAAIGEIAGLRTTITRRHNISASEAILLKSRDSLATKEITDRECLSRQVVIDPTCPREVIQEGQAIADALEQQAMVSINGLHDVIDAMASSADRKTLIVVSAGLPMSNRPGGRPNLDHETMRLASRAAAANVNLYVFYMNVHFLRYFSAEYGKQNHAIFEDITMFGSGLEKFADAAGGSFAQVEVDADPFVDRLLRETSAYYLLAVSSEPSERDGKEHFIRVAVKQRGATVHHRRVVVIPGGGVVAGR